MGNYDKLTKAGIDMDSLLKRLMGNASLIRLFIGKFIQDQNISKLEAAFADGDMKAAEMASHTLKGMCGNLSLTELFGLFSEQVSLLRAGDRAGAEGMMERIRSVYDAAIGNMSQWLSEV